MLQSTTIIAAALALLATQTVALQRPPQFSFPPPGPAAQSFGAANADIFANPNQEINQLSAAAQPPAGGPVALGAAQSSAAQQQSASGDQLISQSLPLPGPQQSQQQQQQPTIQLSRPSLSLTSLTAPGQSSAQSSASSSASSAAASSAASQAAQSSAAARQAQARQRAHQQQPQHQHHHSQPAPAPAARQPQHPANLQTQATSQSANAASQQSAIEAARKAEATAASLAAAQSGSYHCPDSFGFFRHHKSCDKYWACENGTATMKLCGNGLMFDDSDPKRENCAYPFSVDCGADRTDLEAPISTPHCPRLYGLFADTANCRVFYSCWNGEASKYECPPGLAYDNEQRVCVWADLVDRCDQSEVSDGFVCPDPTEVDQPGHYTRHAHPTDCRKFYVCIEGVARPYGCSFGSVFNVDSLQCDEPENVGGCEKYYGDLDPKLAKKLARENAQGQSPSSSSSSASSSSATGGRGPASGGQAGAAAPGNK